MSEQDHDTSRPLVAPGFGRAQDSFSVAIGDILTDELERFPSSGVADIAPTLRRIAFRAGAMLVLGMGVHKDGFSELSTVWDDLLHGVFELFRLDYPGSTWRRALLARERLSRLLDVVIARERTRQQSLDGAEVSHTNVLAHLVALQSAGVPLSDVMIRDQCSSLLMAGHDTTAGSLGWALAHCAFDAGLQDRLVREVDGLLDASQVFSAQVLSHPLIQAFTKEVLRLHHIAPGIGRYVLSPFLYEDVHIPAGIRIFAISGYTQRMPTYFQEPDRFDVDRFLRRHEDVAHPDALFSFGGGAHGCLGRTYAEREMAAVVAAFTSRWRYRLRKGALPEAVFVPSGRPKSLLISWEPR